MLFKDPQPQQQMLLSSAATCDQPVCVVCELNGGDMGGSADLVLLWPCCHRSSCQCCRALPQETYWLHLLQSRPLPPVTGNSQGLLLKPGPNMAAWLMALNHFVNLWRHPPPLPPWNTHHQSHQHCSLLDYLVSWNRWWTVGFVLETNEQRWRGDEKGDYVLE